MPESKPSLVGRLALESAVIIASILAAFALDTWWDTTQERQEERETLQALHLEFSAAKATILYYRGFQDRILGSVASISDSLQQALDRGRRSTTVADTALAWAYIPPTTSVSLGTLQGLISSGRLGILRDRELRAALGSWGIALAELTEEEADSRQLVYSQLDPVLRARISTYGLWALSEGLVDGSLSDSQRAASRPLPVDTEMVGIFSLRQNILSHTLEEFDPLLQEVETILGLIARGLSS